MAPDLMVTAGFPDFLMSVHQIFMSAMFMSPGDNLGTIVTIQKNISGLSPQEAYLFRTVSTCELRHRPEVPHAAK